MQSAFPLAQKAAHAGQSQAKRPAETPCTGTAGACRGAPSPPPRGEHQAQTQGCRWVPT